MLTTQQNTQVTVLIFPRGRSVSVALAQLKNDLEIAVSEFACDTFSKDFSLWLKAYQRTKKQIIKIRLIFPKEAYQIYFLEHKNACVELKLSALRLALFESYPELLSDELLLAFDAGGSYGLEFFSVSPQRINDYFHLLSLSWKTIDSIDSEDFGLATLLANLCGSEEACLSISYNQDIVRCVLVVNYQLRLVKEFTLLEAEDSEKSALLNEKCLHYFRDYKNQVLSIVLLDQEYTLSQLPSSWKVKYLSLKNSGNISREGLVFRMNQEKYSLSLSSEYFPASIKTENILPLIGIGAHYATE